MNETRTNSAETQKVTRLVDYLTRLTSLRSKIIRSVDEYENVLWLKDIPEQNGDVTTIMIPISGLKYKTGASRNYLVFPIRAKTGLRKRHLETRATGLNSCLKSPDKSGTLIGAKILITRNSFHTLKSLKIILKSSERGIIILNTSGYCGWKNIIPGK